MSWKRVCAADAVAENSLKTFNVDGITVLLANLGDVYRAYPPRCPHMAEPLEESGVCQGGLLTCTKHLWQFDMLTGEARGPAERPLKMYEVKQEGNDIMVLIEEELEYEYFGDDEDDDDDDFNF